MNDGSDTEVGRLKQQVQRGDFTEIRQYLIRTRRTQDWQDRCFVLHTLTPFIPLEALIAASDAEPEAADLLLLLGVCYFQRVRKSRGGKEAEDTTPEQFREAEMHIQSMMGCLLRVYEMNRDDPTPHVFAIRGLVVFHQYEDTVKQEYAEAIRLAPECIPTYFAMVSARSEKWAGSHEEALQIARAAMRSGRLGSDGPACLFQAHFLVWQFARAFDKNQPQADRYLKNPAVAQELNLALDRWIGGSYEARRSSIPYLHQAAIWYYLSEDYVRLKRVFALTGDTPCAPAWKQIGDPIKVFRDAQQKAMQKPAPLPAKKAGILGWFKP